MCGRFALKTPTASLREKLHFDNTPGGNKKRYNITPSQQVLTVRLEDGRRIAEMMRWGLIPSWAKDPAIGNRMINVRAETLAVKPAYREAFRRRRCLIPADGFYEWSQSGGRKHPHYIKAADGEVIAFAGLWESWISPDGEEIFSCTIITTDAGPVVSKIHNRMPVILKPEQYDAWLDPVTDPAALQTILTSPAYDSLQTYAVSREVNKPENDSPECIQPKDDATDRQP